MGEGCAGFCEEVGTGRTGEEREPIVGVVRFLIRREAERDIGCELFRLGFDLALGNDVAGLERRR